MAQLLSADLTNRGLVLDPRSKLTLMLSIVFFTMGGVGSDIKAVILISKLSGLIPIVLLLTAKQWKRALAYGGAYAVLTLVSLELLPVLSGGAHKRSVRPQKAHKYMPDRVSFAGYCGFCDRIITCRRSDMQ